MKCKKCNHENIENAKFCEKCGTKLANQVQDIPRKQISENELTKWKDEQNTEKLIFALENGMYDIRIKASEYLGRIEDKSAKLSLIKALSDNEPSVVDKVYSVLQEQELTEEEKSKIQKIVETEDKDNKSILVNELALFVEELEKEKTLKEDNVKQNPPT